MGSVSSTNPGVASLLQILTNVNSPVVSSPAAVAGLEKAPASDIAQLSVEALQLQSMDEMFGISNGANQDPGATLTNLLASSEAAANAQATSTATGSSAASPAPTAAEQMANYQSALQSAETQSLFGIGTTGTLSNPSLNLIG
jgi:hypothetical protein